LNIVDYMKWVGTVARNNHTSHSFYALFVESPTPCCRAKGDKGHILNLYRYTVANNHHSLFQVRHLLYVAQATYKVLNLVNFNRFSTNIKVTLLDGIHYIHDRKVVSPECIGIHLHLVFFYKTSHRSDFRHTFSSR